VKTRHLSDERLLEAMESGPDAAARAHLEACGECRALLEEAKAGLALASEAEVPEPSPFYWEAFRRQVGHRLVADERRSWRVWLLPLAAAAAALVVALPFVMRSPESPAGGPAPVPSWAALPPAEEDDGLAVLEGLGVVESDLVAMRDDSDLAEELGDLSDEEEAAFTDLLRRRMEEGAL